MEQSGAKYAPQKCPKQQVLPTVVQSFHDGGASWWKEAPMEGDALPEVDLKAIWPDIFTKLDINEDGQITANEIEAATKNLYRPIGLWLQSKGEDGPDLDGDGMITKDEWDTALERMMKQFGAPSPRAVEELVSFIKNGTSVAACDGGLCKPGSGPGSFGFDAL